MNKSKYIILPAFFLYLILTGLLLIFNNYSISFLVPLSALCYGICFILIYIKKPLAFNSITILIIIALSFFRMVFIPTIYVLAGYKSTIVSSAGTDYLNEAVLLLVFEMLSFTLMVLSSNKISKINIYNCNFKQTNLHIFVKIIVLSLLFIGVICILIDKNVLAIISTIFNRFTATTEMNIERRRIFLITRENSTIVFELFFQVVFYLQILIPAILVSVAVHKKMNIQDEDKGLLLAILACFVSVIFVTDNNIDSVCILIACLIVLYFAYKSRLEKYLPIGILVGISFILIFLFAKDGMLSSEGIKLSELSSTLCAYFASLPNISCSFAMNYSDKFKTFFGDIVSGIPYMIAFFKGYPQSLTIFNNTAYGFSGITDQIMPLISYGYQFLGIFAPFFTIIVYNIALSFEIEYRKTSITFNKVLFALMFVNMSIGPSIFGFPNTIRRLCYYIPLLIIIYLNNRLEKNNKIESW